MGDMLPPPHTASYHPPSPSQYRGSPDNGTPRGTAQTQPRGGGRTRGSGQDGPEPPTSVDREDQSGCTRQDRQTKRRVRDEVGPQPETPQLPPTAQHQDGVPGPGGYQGAPSQAGTWVIREGRVLACPPQLPQCPDSSTAHLHGTTHSSDWLLGTARPGSPLWLTAPAGSASREGTVLRHPTTPH